MKRCGVSLQADCPGETDIRELAEMPADDWQALFAGETDPFEIEHLHLSWRPKDVHFVLYSDGRAVSHVSVVLRHAVRVGGRRIDVTGVAGVITRPDLRRRGLAALLLQHAIRETQPRAGSAFALLFCRPDRAALYGRLGWMEVASAVHVEQPAGIIEAPLRTMVLPLRDEPWPSGAVWLDSRPW